MWFAGEIFFVAAVSDRRSALRERRHEKTFDPSGVGEDLGWRVAVRGWNPRDRCPRCFTNPEGRDL